MSKLFVTSTLAILAGSLLFAYLYNEHPVVLKVVSGSARVLSPPLTAMVKIDGRQQAEARCFLADKTFDGEAADSLILWIPEPTSYDDREIFIVDRLNHLVGQPSVGPSDYHLMWDEFLFQSETGSLMIPLKSAKSYSEDPELMITGHRVSFRMPSEADHFPGSRIEVSF
jgi:hypothetical protein